MSERFHLAVVGDEPPTGAARTQLELLLRGLHLRADIRVDVAFERGEVPGWRHYASRCLVVDDLRTWAPARWAAPVGPLAAGKVRGAELRRRVRALRSPDVMLRVDETGHAMADRLGPARANGVIATGGPIPDADLPLDVAVVMAGAAIPSRCPPAIIPVPHLIDGAWARAAGLRTTRTEVRHQLGIDPGPLIVGVGGSGAADRLAEILDALPYADDAAPASGLWLGGGSPGHEVVADGIRSAPPCRELVALGDVVVVIGATPRASQLALEAVASGARTIAVQGTVSPGVAQLVDLAPDLQSLTALVRESVASRPDEGRDARMEKVRQLIDIRPVASRLATTLRNVVGEDVAA